MPRFKEIAPGVLVGTSEAYTTNTTIVLGDDGGCLVVDPAVSVDDLQVLVSDLATGGVRPVAGFSTHPHWDHVLWSAELGQVPRYASARAVATAIKERAGLLEGVRSSAPGHDEELVARLTELPSETEIPWDGPVAQVVTHEGHAPGHSAVFLPDTGILLAGDMCSDVEMPLIDVDQTDPVGDYLAGLDLLAELPVRIVVPGHGRIGDADELKRRIAADREYLERLTSGAELADPRVSADWLVAEYKSQIRRLHGNSG